MNTQHKNLDVKKWQKLTLAQQMANIGAEVGRALNWQQKRKKEYSLNACYRALELLDFTLKTHSRFSTLKEISRVRELLVDYFIGENQYNSTPKSWNSYFHPFNIAARS